MPPDGVHVSQNRLPGVFAPGPGRQNVWDPHGRASRIRGHLSFGDPVVRTPAEQAMLAAPATVIGCNLWWLRAVAPGLSCRGFAPS
jgi:hypothetical protein